MLIVDDVTTNRKMVRRCVQQLGCICDEAADGLEAVEMCARNDYDLVIMDSVSSRDDCSADMSLASPPICI